MQDHASGVRYKTFWHPHEDRMADLRFCPRSEVRLGIEEHYDVYQGETLLGVLAVTSQGEVQVHDLDGARLEGETLAQAWVQSVPALVSRNGVWHAPEGA